MHRREGAVRVRDRDGTTRGDDILADVRTICLTCLLGRASDRPGFTVDPEVDQIKGFNGAGVDTGFRVDEPCRGGHGDLYGYFKCRGRQEGLCDLPYLPVPLVERAVIDHYASLALPESFLDEMIARLQEALADEQQTTKDLHDNLMKQLAQLDQQEERLLDLAVDGGLPQSKIRERLHKVEVERKRAREGLSGTSQQLAIGAAVLRVGLDLLRNPQDLYRHAPDSARRALDQTFYQRFYLDEGGHVAHSVMNPPFDELHEAARAEAREDIEDPVATPLTTRPPARVLRALAVLQPAYAVPTRRSEFGIRRSW